METKIILKTALIALVVFVAIISVAEARRGAADEDAENCILKPETGLSNASVTGGFAYIFAGGASPLIILAVAFIVGFISSHFIWHGF
jgi:hypothetical protein